jgi:ligand-binding SRPBCC domain-containing protein
MPLIKLATEIKSTLEISFDLSRSINLHKISTAKTREKAIDGVTSGLINFNETVTWEAIHFGMKQQLTSKITAYNRPRYFCDEQVKGPFKSIRHEHFFELRDDNILMKDQFLFESPFGIAGHLFNKLVLTRYLERLLAKRNRVIKYYAESGKWKELLQ